MSPRKPTYTPLPRVPAEMAPRMTAVLEVLGGAKSVSAAARSLGLSRNHFQSILHRATGAMVEAIRIKASGRPRAPAQLTQLQQQLLRLQRENARLHRRVDSTDRLLQVAGDLLKGRIRPAARPRRARKSSEAGHERPEEPEPGRRQILRGVQQMQRQGLTQDQAAALAGLHASTLRRWRQASEHSETVRGAVPPAEAMLRAEYLVRRLHGLIGADALRHSVAGLSRREAARIKAQTLSRMEHERKAGLIRLTVCTPGVLRGIDAMHLRAVGGCCYALISADGAIPYRTAFVVDDHYNAELVARLLDMDFQHNGAPLVLRLDRARCHDAPPVRTVLDHYAVVALHGPPHCARFYGQLERQNREHRGWIRTMGELSRPMVDECLEDLLEAVNSLWLRRSLGWRTAMELWEARPPMVVSRAAFQQEVNERARRIARKLDSRGQPADLAERLAVEQTLTRMGYLRQQPGGWC